MRCGGFRTSYAQDQAIFESPRARAALGLLLAALVASSRLDSAWWLDLLDRAGIAIIGAVGLNLLTGCTGQISLGNAAFLAIGAYTTAAVGVRWEPSCLLLVPLSGLAASAVGMLFGFPSLRLKGLYLAMATLAAHFVVGFAVSHWDTVTGGVNGLPVPSARLFGLELDDDRKLFYLILPWTVGLLWFARNLLRTRPGKAFLAIRDRDVSAGVMGVDVFWFKIHSFGVSSFFVGVAGSLLAFQSRLISPENFPLSLAIDSLGMIIVGGLGSIAGSVLGAVFLTLLPEALRLATSPLTGHFPGLVALFASIRMGAFGLVMILFLVFEPKGLISRWRRSADWLRTYPFSA
jgi:branched-chain amino acid transport system permease protein